MAPTRQQTLRATMDWSYDLLSQPERLLLARLAVLAGGWTLEAAEAVCSGDGITREEVLDLLARLIDRSLVLTEAESAGSMRYRFLETTREYALERLVAFDEPEATARRHTDGFVTFAERFVAFYLRLAEGAYARLRRADEGVWFHCLDVELNDLRAALNYCRTYGLLQSGLCLAITLTGFWRLSGLAAEGRCWLAEFLGLGAAATDESLRAMALHSLGRLALAQGDDAEALAATEEAVAIARRLASASALLPEGLHQLGWIRHWQGDAERARPALEESLALSRELGHDRSVADNLSDLAGVLRSQRDRAGARELYQQSLVLTTKLDDPTGIATNEAGLAQIFVAEGDPRRPRVRRARITDGR